MPRGARPQLSKPDLGDGGLGRVPPADEDGQRAACLRLGDTSVLDPRLRGGVGEGEAAAPLLRHHGPRMGVGRRVRAAPVTPRNLVQRVGLGKS